MQLGDISLVRKKREDFHISIRRQKRHQYFSQQRLKLKQCLLIQEKNQMQIELDTTQKRQQWLHKIRLQLKGEPDDSWIEPVKNLQKGLHLFKQECYKSWVKEGIIERLCQPFNQEYDDLKLISYISSILANILAVQAQQQSKYVISEITDSQVVFNVTQKLCDENLTHAQAYEMVTLLTNIAYNNRGIVYHAGGLIACINWANRLIQEKNYNKFYISQLYEFFFNEIKQIQGCMCNANFSVVYSIIEILSKFIKLEQTAQLYNMILDTLYRILQFKRTKIYEYFLTSPSLISVILQLGSHKDLEIRLQAWHFIVTLTTCQELKFYQTMFDLNILDNIYQYHENHEEETKEKIIRFHLGTLSNLASQSQQAADIVLRHKVIQIVIRCAHINNPINIVSDSIYTLTTLCLFNNYNLHCYLIEKIDILHIHCCILETITEPYIIQQILLGIYNLIQVENRMYRKEGNRVINILQNKYYFQRTLQGFVDQYANSKQIFELIQHIFDLYSTN